MLLGQNWLVCVHSCLSSGTLVLSLPILNETSEFRPGGILSLGTGFYSSLKRTYPGGGTLPYCMVTGRYRMRPCPSPYNLLLHWESVPSQSLELSPPGQPQEQGPDFLLDPGPFPSLLSQNVLASEPAKYPFHF